jgi:voltage-gated potassium channel
MPQALEYITSSLAVLSIAVILVEYFYPLTETQLTALYVFDAAVVAVLAADFANRARRGGRKYLIRNSYEVLALIPAVFFTALEQSPVIGAALRGLRLLRFLRIVILSARGLRAVRMLSAYGRQAHLGYLLAVSAVVVAVGTFSAYILESDIPDSRIRDLGDAFWWALATVTTVGYGDVVPVTALGRAVGAVLMVSGIAILSVFISSLGAFLIKTAATPKTLTDEVKETIKKKIDNIENLTQQEVEELLQIIQVLHVRNRRGKL